QGNGGGEVRSVRTGRRHDGALAGGDGQCPEGAPRRLRRPGPRAADTRLDTLRVALAQLDLVVGDVAGNARQVLETAERARREHRADVVAFPELTLCGYPPEDLLFHGGFRRRIGEALELVRERVRGVAVLVGFPEYTAEGIYNAAALYRDGACLAHYRKQVLPNYGVFDEKRYFLAGLGTCT